mmetsp:Transcript_78211/g.138505  ORF Transcript_78211/g.138505 Transcript_78211/m.138505 type:complete len:341 (-) Transcript_78211:84-1106(-)
MSLSLSWPVVLILAMLSFSFMDCMSSKLEETVSPVIVLGCRGAVISLCNSMPLASAKVPLTVETWHVRWVLLARCINGYVAFYLFLKALSLIPVADALVIFSPAPFWATLFGTVFLRQWPPAMALPAGMMCILGLILVVQPPSLGFQARAERQTQTQSLGILCAALASLGAGGSFLMTHYLKHGVHYLVVTQYFALSCVPISVVHFLVMGLPKPKLDVQLVAMLALTGLFGYGGQVGLNKGMQTATSVALASMMTFLEVPLATLWSCLALGQFPGILQMLGMALTGSTIVALALIKERADKYAELQSDVQPTVIGGNLENMQELDKLEEHKEGEEAAMGS